MNVLYALSHFTDWVFIADQLKKNLDWSPKYWVCTSVTESLINETFPECITQSYLDIIRATNPIGYDLYAPIGIDEELLSKYAIEMDIAIKMMDRLDSGDGFNYNERKNFFIRLLNYSYNVLNSFAPEFALFTEIPHHAAQYVLYAVLKKEGVNVLMFKVEWSLGPRVLIYDDIYADPMKKMGEYVFNQDVPDEIHTQIKLFIDKKRSCYNEGIPVEIKKLNAESSQSSAILSTVKRLLKPSYFFRSFDKSKFSTIKKLRGKMLEDSEINKVQLYKIKWRGFRYVNNLKKAYDKYADIDIDLTADFVYVPLHYQPERTTCPDGGIYVNQLLVVQQLRAVLPQNIQIFVKEHKSQFSSQREGHLGRFEFEYKAISEMINVSLVPLNTDPFDLIDQSICLVTVSGTAGFEAIARKKPVVVFGGGCWYRSLPGVSYVQNKKQLKDVLDEIFRGDQIQEHEIYDFFIDFYKRSFVGAILPQFRHLISPDENIEVMTKAITGYVRNVMRAKK